MADEQNDTDPTDESTPEDEAQDATGDAEDSTDMPATGEETTGKESVEEDADSAVTGEAATSSSDPSTAGPPPTASPGAPDAMSLATAGHAPAGGRRYEGAEWRNTANERNAVMLGQLHIYYAERTVVLPVDGDTALRAIAAWRYRQRRRWEDRLDPSEAPGAAAWLAFDFQGVLALLWMPGLPGEAPPERMALDPTTA